MGKLLEELKRRKVFRVAAVYAVVAWVLIQVADTMLPALQMPQWTVSFVTVLFILGFPIAVILAWAYEATPEGVRAAASEQALQPVAQASDQKLIYTILVLVVALGGFQVADRFLFDSEPNQVISPIASSNGQVRRSILPLGPMVYSQGGDDASRTTLSLSPDGSRLAYTVHSDGKIQLYIRELNQLEPRPLGAAFDGATPTSLAFSPDGEALAYYEGGDLKRISVNGGGSQTIAVGVGSRLTVRVAGLDWAEDNTIVLTDQDNLRLMRMTVNSGSGQIIDIPSAGSGVEFHGEPQVLPGGDAMLFTRRYNGPSGGRNIELVGTDTTEARILIQNARNASYVSTGHIAFMREGSLWAVPFNLGTLQINGSEVMLIENIESLAISSTYTLSDNGDLIYLEGGLVDNGAPRSTLSWVDRSGVETPIEMEAMAFAAPELSPDDNRVALVLNSPQGTDIWSYELVRGTLSRITFSNYAHSPLWSSDGERIVYSTPAGPESINASGIGATEQLASVLPNVAGVFFPTAITPDGTDILTYVGGGRSRAIYRLRQTPEQTTFTPLLNSAEFAEGSGALSPNGRWLAYVSNETGQEEVYIRPYPDVGSGKWQISTAGGRSPRWAAETGELFYRNRGDNLVETYGVAISEEGQFSAAIPELLFSSEHYALAANSYMVTADGQRFLMMRPELLSTATGVIVDTNLVLVENFAEELRRLVPADPQ